MGTLPECSWEKAGKICDSFHVPNPVIPQKCYFMNMVILPQIDTSWFTDYSQLIILGNQFCMHVEMGF